MKEPLQQPIKEVTRIFRKYHLSYDQSRHVFRQARKLAELKVPKNRKKCTVTRLSKDHLQVILGHESPETTEIYTHIAARDVKKEFKKITNL